MPSGTAPCDDHGRRWWTADAGSPPRLRLVRRAVGPVYADDPPAPERAVRVSAGPGDAVTVRWPARRARLVATGSRVAYSAGPNGAGPLGNAAAAAGGRGLAGEGTAREPRTLRRPAAPRGRLLTR